MNELAIVILNFNGASYLQKFLPGVLRYSKGCEIIVADNASTDNSLDILNKNFPEVRVIKLKKNYGFSEGYNQALAKVDKNYAVLLNSDVEVTENWWQRPLNLLKSDRSIAAVQPKILAFKNKKQFEYAGAGGGYIDRLGYPFCRGRIFMSIESDKGQYNDNHDVFWASGACMFVKTSCYFEVGGLDKDFFAHMEEIDLCWRLQHQGYKIMYCGQSHVYHVGGGTLEQSHPRKTYLNFRNGLTLLYKNLRHYELWYLLPFRILLDWVAAIKFAIVDSRAHSAAVLKAHKDFFGHLKLNRKKRGKMASKNRKHPETIYPGSIIFAYYMKRKKKFGELNF